MPARMSARAGSIVRARAHSVCLSAALAAAFALSGCVTDGVSTHTRGMSAAGQSSSASAVPGSGDARQQVERWGQRYESEPNEKANILGYADALRRNDQLDQATEVLRRGLIKQKKDREISAAYGKVLAQSGHFKEALNVIQQAQTPTQPDWRLMSAEAAIHDQLGDHQNARHLYTEALKIVPGEPSVLNNLAMSYVLDNDLTTAEKILRTAMAGGAKNTRIRQNLALVLGLQGRFAEAEQVASADLPPAEVKANMAYLKRMLAQRGKGSSAG
ncbi:Flp pilus assembly protein TadD [Breoghania corrubedonensis]|uniref:Flp pilus assembly protein TadD n=1 Tax=Breoghania corrubedonensis TaxID=665038 RepID=A0A2T5VGE9_9HYPH|nr:tetratricopeptide repeat protein [Breoghania corrubedonensis]PTW62837.1 Flp pilus assembly protein TadD [Breoghania corrubedonensis]